jgi:nucleotide-binding universal stress UspA family protein
LRKLAARGDAVRLTGTDHCSLTTPSVIDRILIPLDGSERSDGILLIVRQLLFDLEGANVELLRVIRPMAHVRVEWNERPDPSRSSLTLRRESARRHLGRIREGLARDGIEASVRVILGVPAAAILARVEAFQPSLVAMATHGRTGLARLVRGSVAERVLRRSPVPVLLCNPTTAVETVQGLLYRRILVPLDGSERATRVVPLVLALAQRYGSGVHLMRVVVPLPLPSAEAMTSGLVPVTTIGPEEALASLESCAEGLRHAGVAVRCSSPIAQSAAAGILEAVDQGGVGLVAMTTHGASGLDRMLFGSVAEKVLRRCRCPLLVQREVTPWRQERPRWAKGT